jgi:hypothetical protein
MELENIMLSKTSQAQKVKGWGRRRVTGGDEGEGIWLMGFTIICKIEQ